MKIAHVVNKFFPGPAAGSNVYVHDLAIEQQRMGHNVNIFSRAQEGAVEVDSASQQNAEYPIDYEYDGLPVRVINPGSQAQKTVYNFTDERLDKIFKGWLERIEPDIIHFSTPQNLSLGFFWLAKASGARTVLTVHDHWFICPIYLRLRPDQSVCKQHAGAGCLACVYPSRDKRRTRWIPWQVIEYGLLPILKPLLHKFHTNSFTVLSWLESRPKTIFEALKWVDKIIVPSRYLIEKLHTELDIPRQKLLEIGHGIDTSPYIPPRKFHPIQDQGDNRQATNPTATVQLNRDSARILRLGYLGYFGPQKGLLILLQALTLLDRSRISLRVAGGRTYGSYGAHLKRLAEQVGSVLEGPLEHKDVVRFFGEIDVLVVPSICEETFSFVTREAFAARVPVVASNLGALGEAIQDEVDGLLFMPGNSEDLARKIARLADSPDLVEQLSKNILPVKTIQEYAREVIDLYHDLSGNAL